MDQDTYVFGLHKCDNFLYVSYVIDVLTLNNYPSEASIMVARQLEIVSQSDAFKILAIMNIQYVFKTFACLIVFFLKDMFDIYLINICHIVISFHLVR